MNAVTLNHPAPEVSLYCPIPSTNHPEADTIEIQSIDWITSFGLYADSECTQQLHQQHVAQLASRVMPTAPAERVRILSDLVIWSTVDDQCEDEQEDSGKHGTPVTMLAQLVRSLETDPTTKPGDSPWVTALQNLRHRLDDYASPTQITRWCAALRAYALGIAWESGYRRRDTLPNLNEYLMMRPTTIAIGACIALNDVIAGNPVTTAELTQPRIHALTDMTKLIIGIDNDLLSYAKEKDQPGPCLNIIEILAHDRKCSPSLAVPQILALRHTIMCRYLALRDEVQSSASDAVCDYLACLDRWIRALLDMATHGSRYQKRGLLTITNDAGIFSPMPSSLPAIAWMWSA